MDTNTNTPTPDSTDWCGFCNDTTTYTGETCDRCGRVWGYDKPGDEKAPTHTPDLRCAICTHPIIPAPDTDDGYLHAGDYDGEGESAHPARPPRVWVMTATFTEYPGQPIPDHLAPDNWDSFMVSEQLDPGDEYSVVVSISDAYLEGEYE